MLFAKGQKKCMVLDNSKKTVPVEVVYISPTHQRVIPLSIYLPLDVLTAIQQSGILDLHPELGDLEGRVGIFGRRVSLTTSLSGGERIEIYRPLIKDPKDARREKAKMQRKAQLTSSKRITRSPLK